MAQMLNWKYNNHNAWLFLCLLVNIGSTFGQIRAVVRDTAVINVKPGSLKTISLSLVNESEETLSLYGELVMPQKWRCIGCPKALTLAPRQKKLLLLNIKVPSLALMGPYEISYQLKNSQSKVLLELLNFSFSVLEIEQFALWVEEGPTYALAGRSIQTKFAIKNEGNHQKSVSLEVKNGVLKGAGNDLLTLGPGQSQSFDVVSLFPNSIDRKEQLTIQVVAHLKDRENVAHANHDLVVYPSAESVTDNRRKLDGSLRISAVRQYSENQDQTIVQGELSITGALDSASEKQVELLLRGPNQFNQSGLTSYDEYYFGYQNRSFNAKIGDQSVGVSPLIEQFRFGRGVSLGFQKEHWAVDGFAVKPRFLEGVRTTIGMQGRWLKTNKQWLQWNGLMKAFQNGNAFLGGALGNWQFSERFQISGEWAVGLDQNRQIGQGAMFQIDSHPLKKVFVSGGLIWADQSFPGFYQHTTNLNALLSYNLSRSMVLVYSIQRDQQNVVQDSIFGLSPAIDQQQISLSAALGRSFRVSGQIGRVTTLDKQQLQRFHFMHSTGQINIQYVQPFFHCLLSGSLGVREDFLGEETLLQQTQQVGLQSQFRIGKRWDFSIFGSYANRDVYEVDGEEQLIGGIAATYSTVSGASARIYFQNTYSLREYFRDRDLLNLFLEQPINDQFHISLLARYAIIRRSIDQTDFGIMANGVWKFAVPVEPKGESYDVHGRLLGVINQEVLVYLGGRAVLTKPDGSFSFKHIARGNHQLLVDEQSLNLRQIVIDPLPLEVEVKDADPSYITIQIGEGSTLKGRVLWDPLLKPSQKSDLGVFIIILENGDQQIKRATTPDGLFEMTKLSSGVWKIRVMHPAFGKSFELKDPKATVELIPGKTELFDVVIVPKKRKIKFQSFSPIKKNNK